MAVDKSMDCLCSKANWRSLYQRRSRAHGSAMAPVGQVCIGCETTCLTPLKD